MLIQKEIKSIIYIISSLLILVNSQTYYIVNDTDIINQAQYSSVYGIPEKEQNITKLKNNIEFNFTQDVTVDRLLYQTQNITECYPTELLIYYSESGNGDYILLNNITSNRTDQKVMFVFSKEVTCKQIKIEYSKINETSSCSDKFQFYQPENNETMQALDLFSDYAETVVKKEITPKYLDLIKEVCQKNINYETELYPNIERATKFLLKSNIFVPKREFSTNPNANNVIRRNGDIKNYINDKLKMVNAGTNNQPTGIFGLSNDNIIVYLSAKKEDKLPKIKFSQYLSNFEEEQDLKIGKNTFKFPFFYNYFESDNDNSTTSDDDNEICGGPIYIINPYTENEQSEDVKIYIEGGHFFPLYIKGKNEKDFYNSLSQYVQLLEKFPETYIDLMELWGERVLMTIDSTKGYKIYHDGKSPNHNLEVWDEYIKHLYNFSGVKYENNEQFYDKKNYWININIRHIQLNGTKKEIDENNGIFGDDLMNAATYTDNITSIGWNFAQKIGYMIDISEQTVSNTTNNMESKYDECYLKRECTRGAYIDNLLYLTPDVSNNSLRYNNGPYWNKGNFLFWWQIETLFPGYWGKLNNMYRYNNINDIAKTEKQVYFSSIITGVNMSYYYERYGFYLKDTESNFVYSKTSQKFQEMMKKLVDNGTITNNILKFWYLSGPTYMYNVDNNKSDNSSCYKNNKSQINIIKVLKINDGYSLFLPTSTCQEHLGYELYENDKIINFTMDTVFIDKIKYDDNYVPTYKIKAYDKLLESTDLSESKTIETDSEVCIYNSKSYSSIADAVKNIPNNENKTNEIILKKNTYESQIEINANIIIKLDQTESKGITIINAAKTNIFKVNANKNLTIIGNNENVKLVLEGNNISQNNSLIENYGILHIEHTEFRNSINTEKGGAINNLEKGQLYIYESLFENNKAQSGGALFINSPEGKGEIINVIFRENVANHGGCLYNNDGIITIKNSQILNNKANENGGGLYINGKTTLQNTIIKNNIALLNGGGIYENGTENEKNLIIEENSIINNNTAINGGGFYFNQGIAYFNFLAIYDNIVSNLGSNTYLGNNSPTLYIKGKDNKLEGEIYKNSGGNLYIENDTFSLQQENKPLILKTNYSEKEVLLLKSNNYVFKNDDLKLFSAAAGDLSLANNSELWLRFYSYNLTYKSSKNNTNAESHECYYGEIITVNYKISENEYISKIVDDNGKIYNIGDQIVINDSLNLTVEIQDLYQITLDFLEGKVEYYTIPNSYFYLPVLNNKSNDESKYIITHWKDVEGNYIFDKINITNNGAYFDANYEGNFYVKYNKENERIESYLAKCNETIVLEELEEVEVDRGYELKFEFNGTKYNTYDEIVINKNMNFIITVTETDAKIYLIVFIVLFFIILILVIIYIYILKKRKKDKGKSEIEEGLGLYELQNA